MSILIAKTMYFMYGAIAPGTKQKQQHYGDRGSWLRFLTNSFHGVLGASSLLVTLAAWIANEYCSASTGLPLGLTLLSVLTTTVLSIHSSWYMLQQSPHQSTILDFRSDITIKNAKHIENNEASASGHSFRVRVVAPHRGAFHRTSIIMQYANARILLILQRKHWQHQQLNSSRISISGILLWGLTTLMCLRMLLGERMPSLQWLFRFCKNSKRKTMSSVSSTKAETTLKPLPPFWKNGNSYCFVLPMILGVCGDFVVSAWCEYSYFFRISFAEDSLFRYFSDHWLSLWHLLFLQVVAHVIAFAFTLAFRIKHSKQSFPLLKRFYNIQTLYWVCTVGVYTLVVIGIVKARTTLRLLW